MSRCRAATSWATAASQLGARCCTPTTGEAALAAPCFWMNLADTGGLAAILKGLATILSLPPADLAGLTAVDETPAQCFMAGFCGRRACSNLACPNVSGASEAELGKGRRCSGCNMVSYCGLRCQRQAWPQHKLVCSKLGDRMYIPAATGWVGLRAPGS